MLSLEQARLFQKLVVSGSQCATMYRARAASGSRRVMRI
jgi:hypothetical protein